MAKVHAAQTEEKRGRSVASAFYALMMRSVFQRILVPRFADERRISQGRAQWARLFNSENQPQGFRIWWHAASVGELEILWPVMMRLAQQGRERNSQGVPFLPPLQFIVTVLSESAEERLGKLLRAFDELGVTPVFAGYSPWEGDWDEALRALRPNLFVTSKYEAWPDLWMSLASAEIPLSIVSAKDRRSLTVCRNVCRLLGASLPKLNLLASVDGDERALRESFPGASVQVVGEPRWDQVWMRAKAGNVRAREIASAMGSLPRPWGVLGSAWSEDLHLWKNILAQPLEDGVGQRLEGTVLIVPHRVDSEHVKPLEEILKQSGIPYLRTGDYSDANDMRQALSLGEKARCVLVNEMGFLSELYLVADWAYVGGGIGRGGVHSTIEPAIHGIPICCGSHRADQFVEIAELRASGQLTQVETDADVSRWVEKIENAESDRWKAEAQGRRGATDRIVNALRSFGDF